MKIIHIVAAKEWGGGEAYVLSLALEQSRHGHDVEIICARRPAVVSKFRSAGLKVTTMQINGHLNWLSPIRIALKSRRKQNERSVIHVHRFADNLLISNAVRLLTYKKRPAFIYTRHISEPAPTDSKYDNVYNDLDKIIFVSKKSEEGFMSSSPAIDRSKLTVIHNSITTDQKTKSDEPKKSAIVSLCFVGRIYREKGLHTLIKALPKINNSTLTVCGTGQQSYINELHIIADDLGVAERIKWVGFTDNTTEYISRADIGVVPSSWAEPFGLVILEFMSQSVPVVSSNNGAQPEIITDGVDGLLVPPEDPDALAAAINRLIDDQDLLNKIGKAGYETFKNRFSYDKFYNQVMEAYESAISHK